MTQTITKAKREANGSAIASSASGSATIEDFARAELARVGIMDNLYFARLQNGSMSKRAFARSQKQFYFAVAFYSRPMGILLARLPQIVERISLLRNMLDEHGGLNAARSHDNTFRQFLQRLGCHISEDTLPSPAVQAFNGVLTATCAFDEIEVGIACMGVIELAFAEISAKIGAAAVQRGFVRESELVHYTLHRDLDVKHADDFFNMLEKAWTDPTRRGNITRGLALGAHIFDRLYRELLIISETVEA